MSADIGSKYKVFGKNEGQILTHDLVGPKSQHFLGMPWMQDVDKEFAAQTIVSARNLKNCMSFKHEEPLAYKTGLKSSKIT